MATITPVTSYSNTPSSINRITSGVPIGGKLTPSTKNSQTSTSDNGFLPEISLGSLGIDVNSTKATPTPTADPYAAWGGTSAYNSLVSGYDAQKNNIYGSAGDAAGAAGSKLNLSILDFLDSARQGQKNVDLKGAQNELAKQQGMQGILGMVGRGIKSGGVTLANRNAGDSSAAGALADAYSQLGRQQAATVGNQYEMGNQEVQNLQAQQDLQLQSGARNIQGSKMDAVNNIVNDARTQFAALDSQIAQANLPQRIAIDQAKEQVRQQALQALQQYDAQLNSGVSSIHASSPDERRAQAAGMAAAGTNLGADAFNYTTEAPAQFQDSGPYASDLPLFSLNKKNQQQFA